MGKLIYTFTSYASRVENNETCLTGMRLLADTLHPFGVKITWLVSAASARLAATELTEWHTNFGDDIAVQIPGRVESLDETARLLKQEIEGIQQALPWSNPVIAGGDHRHPEIGSMLESIGIEGLWGFCWEQIEADDITDRGCPWGFYYIDPAERLRPARGRGVIGMEWTARDLLKSFHSGDPTAYSTDPNDVGRTSLCSWEHIDYWKGMADNYIRNTRYNEVVLLQQHQEAHEMERTQYCTCYTKEDILESAVMLREFVRHIQPHAEMMTLPEAARFYREQFDHTPSSYMLWDDVPTPPANRDYNWSLPEGPWPRTFLYYDRGAQMMFIQGKVEPVCIRNYSKQWDTVDYFAEYPIPRARLEKMTRYHWNRELEILVKAPKAMPYGLALWGDYSLYQIDEAPGLIEGKMLPHELLFLRYDLQEGENRLKVFLKGK